MTYRWNGVPYDQMSKLELVEALITATDIGADAVRAINDINAAPPSPFVMVAREDLAFALQIMDNLRTRVEKEGFVDAGFKSYYDRLTQALEAQPPIIGKD